MTDKVTLKDAVIDLLLKLPLFDEIDGEELQIISGYMSFFKLPKGKYLFKEGDKGNFICFIVKGAINIIKKSGSGDDKIIATIHKGASIGEMTVIDSTVRSAAAQAKTDVTLVILSENSFNTICDKHPKIGIKMLKAMTRILSLNMRRTSSLLADYMPVI